VTFDVGVALAHFDVSLVNDERWKSIRDFSCEIQEVVEGTGMLGDLVCTVCHVVDDDIYPVEIKRTIGQPRRMSEFLFPSSVHSEFFLTPEEFGDVRLIWGFLKECLKDTWPFSLWGVIWSVYRGAYSVIMTLVVVILIDYVWISEAQLEQWKSASQVELKTELDNRLWTAVVLAVGCIFATLTHCKTETWVLKNAKYGAVTSSLRTNIVTQLLFADDGRLSSLRTSGVCVCLCVCLSVSCPSSLRASGVCVRARAHARVCRLSSLRTSEYLNIATNEVESAARCCIQVFPAVERLAHFVLEVCVCVCVCGCVCVCVCVCVCS
jgi:hypothetical protein